MSRKKKEPAGADEPAAGDRTPKDLELPAAGLAEEILAGLERGSGSGDEQRGGGDPHPDQVYRFADRVQAAQGREREEEAEAAEPWVAFRLGGETFAFPVLELLEVVRLESLTRVPHAPFPVAGLTTVRGRILPVVDLGLRLGLEPVERTEATRVLRVASRGRNLGLLVDRVDKVVHLLPSRMEPAPEDVLSDRSEYIVGIYDLEPELLILLDMGAVLRVNHAPEETAPEGATPEASGPEEAPEDPAREDQRPADGDEHDGDDG